MADEEVVIRIAAKNLTEAEFKKARQQVAKLGGQTEKTSRLTKSLATNMSGFFKAHAASIKAASIAIGAVAGAAGVAAAAVVKFGREGAVIADVESDFGKLSKAAGETSGVMLGALAKGVKGTVSNFELMKSANVALGAGLLDSARDAQTLSEGARLLAKRTGGDTKQAFDQLVRSIASGRTTQLKQMGVFVDQKKAVEDYAASLGKNVSSLTDVDRAAALQQATMAALRGELERTGVPLADFGELIDQQTTFFKNFTDQLSVGISQSPVLLGGLRGLGEALQEAFGADQEETINAVVQGIERGAILAVDFGKVVLTGAKFAHMAWSGLTVPIRAMETAVQTALKTFLKFAASSLEMATSIPGIGSSFEGAAQSVRFMADMVDSWSIQSKDALKAAIEGAKGQDEFAKSLDGARAMLDKVQQKMLEGSEAAGEFDTTLSGSIPTITNAARAHAMLGVSVGVAGAAENRRIPIITSAARAQELLNASVGLGREKIEGVVTETITWKEATGEITNVMGSAGNILSVFGVEVDSTIGKTTRLISTFDDLTGSIKNITGFLSGGGGGLGLGSLFGGLFAGDKNVPGSSSFVGPLLPEMQAAGAEAGKGLLSGFGSTVGGGLKSLGSTLAPLFTNPFTAAVGAGLAGFFTVKGILGREASAETTAKFLGLDFDALSEDLRNRMQQMGEEAGSFAAGIQMNIGGAFSEGAFTVDQFAGKVADTFSFLERGELNATQAQQLLNETVAQLLPHLDELGPAGEAQIQRLINAAQEFGVTFEGLAQLGGPISSSVEEIAQQFGITTGKAKELAEFLGVNVKTKVQQIAQELGVPPKKLREIGEAVENRFGIPLTGIQGLLDTMGISIEDLADAFKIKLPESAAATETSIENISTQITDMSKTEIRIPVSFDVADLDLPSGEVKFKGAQAGGLFSRPAIRVVAEREPEVVGSPNAIVRAFRAAMDQAGIGARVSTPAAMNFAPILEGFERMESRLATLPLSLQRAVRDGVLLAT